MGLFDAFRKSPRDRRLEEARRRAMREDLEVYSGMRVEVTSSDGRIFLVGRLLELRGDRARLEPCADGSLITLWDEPIAVTLRGRSSRGRRAVILEGTIRMGSDNFWQAERLSLVQREEHRANLRLETSLEGCFTLAGQPGVPAAQCQIRNIGMGGVCIGSQARRDIGDKLLLQVRGLPDLRGLPLPCQLLRIQARKPGYFEYGCRFLELDEAAERRLIRAMYALYRQFASTQST